MRRVAGRNKSQTRPFVAFLSRLTPRSRWPENGAENRCNNVERGPAQYRNWLRLRSIGLTDLCQREHYLALPSKEIQLIDTNVNSAIEPRVISHQHPLHDTGEFFAWE